MKAANTITMAGTSVPAISIESVTDMLYGLYGKSGVRYNRANARSGITHKWKVKSPKNDNYFLDIKACPNHKIIITAAVLKKNKSRGHEIEVYWQGPHTVDQLRLHVKRTIRIAKEL